MHLRLCFIKIRRRLVAFLSTLRCLVQFCGSLRNNVTLGQVFPRIVRLHSVTFHHCSMLIHPSVTENTYSWFFTASLNNTLFPLLSLPSIQIFHQQFSRLSQARHLFCRLHFLNLATFSTDHKLWTPSHIIPSNLRIHVFSDATLCRWVSGSRRFEGSCRIPLQGQAVHSFFDFLVSKVLPSAPLDTLTGIPCWQSETPVHAVVVVVVVVVVIIVIISFMQGIYTYIPETNYVPREYSVAAIL